MSVIENKKIYIFSKQSANVLFKFMGNMDFLKNIIRKKAFIPRYNEENLEYLNIYGVDKIVFPMVCFCDINLSRLDSHVKYYGPYGIALKKKWGIEKGIQPIHYINENSYIRKDLSYLFSKSYNALSQNEEVSEYNDYLLTHLLFIKPLVGKMLKNEEYDEKNFTDEKEWRYVPEILEEDNINLIIPSVYIDRENAYDYYSNKLNNIEHLWLHFDYEDIEYIMVSSEKDREEFISFIEEEIDNEEDKMKKYILISKIIVYDIINKDW